jgi:hypothetical protein
MKPSSSASNGFSSAERSSLVLLTLGNPRVERDVIWVAAKSEQPTTSSYRLFLSNPPLLGSGSVDWADNPLGCVPIRRDERATAHPEAQIPFTDTGSVTGQYDPSRMAQVFSNFIGNAVRHGNAHFPIYVTLVGDGLTTRFCVQNYGEPIPPSALPSLFNLEGHYSKYSEGDHELPRDWGWDYS